MSPHPELGTRLLISGASGTIGRALATRPPPGTTIAALVRPGRSASSAVVHWDPAAGTIDEPALRNFAPSHVIHLAGESVFGRWNADKKRRIYHSRVRGTSILARALAALEPRPLTLLSASAVGFYGHAADQPLDESTPPGEGFLAEVCRDWESATAPAEQAGIRVAHLRIGVVLDPASGALRGMLPAFRLGLGGPIAGGQTWIPWITLADTVAAILHTLHAPTLTGAVNIVSPAPVTQAEFARTLAGRLQRPALIPVPRVLLTLALGEFARETALKSVRAVPAALLASGFRFAHPTLDQALAEIL